jgi:hypothetical protein
MKIGTEDMGKNRETREWNGKKPKQREGVVEGKDEKREAMKKITQDKTRQKNAWQAHKGKDSNNQNKDMNRRGTSRIK